MLYYFLCQALPTTKLHSNSKANACFRHFVLVFYANAGGKKTKTLHVVFIVTSHNSVDSITSCLNGVSFKISY